MFVMLDPGKKDIYTMAARDRFEDVIIMKRLEKIDRNKIKNWQGQFSSDIEYYGHFHAWNN